MQADKVTFLRHLRKTGNVSGACQAAGVSRASAYRWKGQDPDFAEAWNDATEAAIDDLEEAARDRAINGGTYDRVVNGVVEEMRAPPSDRMLAYLLTAHRYNDRMRGEQVHRHEHVVKLSDAQLEQLAAKAAGMLGERNPGMLGERNPGMLGDGAVVDAELVTIAGGESEE